MSSPGANTLAVVELSNSDEILDRYGVSTFNLVHQEFEFRLREWMRSNDHGKALGENRFMVILRGIDSEAQLKLAVSKLNRILEEPFDILDEIVLVHIHTGFAIMDGEVKRPKEALRLAVQALQQAKKRNRAYQLFDIHESETLEDDRVLVARLSEALERGELHVFYQPKFHAGFRSLVGAEALIRWVTKDKKIIMPDQFITVAEHHPVIKPLTWWVIKTSVARLARWPEELSVAVNVSPVLLHSRHLHTTISDALTLYDVKPSRLIIEVTERIKVEDQVTVYEALSRLKTIGIKISIDDFGTGFSSLSYFRNFPADELKIDKEFVAQMVSSKKDQTIVKAIIELAHNFSLKVVAEGVENSETANLLREMRCDILQGYLFDKPLPVEEFEKNYHLNRRNSGASAVLN